MRDEPQHPANEETSPIDSYLEEKERKDNLFRHVIYRTLADDGVPLKPLLDKENLSAVLEELGFNGLINSVILDEWDRARKGKRKPDPEAFTESFLRTFHNSKVSKFVPDFVKERNDQIVKAYESLVLFVDRLQGFISNELLRGRIESNMTKEDDIRAVVRQCITPFCNISCGCDEIGIFTLVYSLDHRIEEIFGVGVSEKLLRAIHDTTSGSLGSFTRIGSLSGHCYEEYERLLKLSETNKNHRHKIASQAEIKEAQMPHVHQGGWRPEGHSDSSDPEDTLHGQDAAEAKLTKAKDLYAKGDYEECVEILRELAQEENPNGLFFLGMCFFNGLGTLEDVEAGLELFHHSAELGYNRAQYVLGRIYLLGTKVPRSLSDGLRWTQSAAEGGFPEAQTTMGHLYFEGEDLPRDLEKAVEWFRKGAEGEDPGSLYHLGEMHRIGEFFPKSLTKAVELFEKAAMYEDDWAQLTLGVIYAFGEEEIEQDPTLARHWFEKAEENGNPNAKFHLGMMYYYGNGVVADYVKAAHLLKEAADAGVEMAEKALGEMQTGEFDHEKAKKAAEEGDAYQQYNLGLIYQFGHYGYPKDDQIAFEWFMKSAQQGEALAQFEAGWGLYSGRGTEKNIEEGLHWVGLAADKDVPGACFILGMHHFDGINLPPDDVKCLHWLSKAAHAGHRDGQFYYGWMHFEGRGVKQNIEIAKQWFERSAENGCPEGMYHLGRIQLDHDNLKEGMRWLKLAAELEEQRAQLILGLYLIEAERTQEEKKEGLVWIERAARGGYGPAQQRLGELYQTGELLPKDEAQAELWLRRARENQD